ncbi:tailspike protein [Acinetobacter phage F70-K44]|uniref:Tailspike protein n=1 Tax=Acinetobacter phage F70-K44 TaxID=3027985 RepID=A0AAF0CD47_9CAUD|nr:tailspike protein [Acinetobacter phage F70-K44]
MNTLRSFTETVVTTPTDTFPISFEYDEKYDAVHVFLNDVAVEDLGYTVSQVNAVTLKVEPAIPEGTVRIERETDIDKMKYIFDAGALFIDQNVDADFRQIVHSQQEVRDGFIKLRGDVLPLVHGLQEALKQAQEASQSAQEAAEAAAEAAAQSRSAENVIDANGLNQQEINNNLLGSTGSSYIKVNTELANSVVKSLKGMVLDYSIDVTWFGAKGDWNKSTQTGTDNTVAVANAIAYLATLGTRREGGRRGLYFPKGSYMLKHLDLIAGLGFGIDVFGDGSKTTTLYFDHTEDSPAMTCSIEFVRFFGMTLCGTKDELGNSTRTVGFEGKLTSNLADIDVQFTDCDIICWNTFAKIHGRGCIFTNCMIGITIRVMDIVVGAYTVGADTDNMQSKYATMRHYVFRGCRFDNASRAYTVSGAGEMLGYINNLLFLGNDITNMDLLIEAPTATFCNSVIAGNTAIGSFATKFITVNGLRSVVISGNNTRKLTNVTGVPNSNTTSTEFFVEASSILEDVIINGNIVSGLRGALVRLTSTANNSRNVSITNNQLLNFGSWKGGNSAISVVLANSNIKGLLISSNILYAPNVAGSYYLCNLLGKQVVTDTVVANNITHNIKLLDAFSIFQPTIYVNGIATTGTYSTRICRYSVEGDYIVGSYYFSGTVPENVGYVAFDLPVPAVPDFSPFSNDLSGYGVIEQAVGLLSTGYSWCPAKIEATTQRLVLRKTKDMSMSDLQGDTIPATYSMVVRFKYRFK